MITRDKMRAFRMKLDALLKEADLEGYSVRVGSGSYSDTNFSFKIEGAEIGESGIVKDKDYETLKELGAIYGLGNDAYGKKITLNGSTFTIKGLNTRRRKYPVSAVKDSTGKRFKLPLEDVKRALNA